MVNFEDKVVHYYPLLILDPTGTCGIDALVLDPGEITTKRQLFDHHFKNSDKIYCIPIEASSFIDIRQKINEVLDEFDTTGRIEKQYYSIFR